jgi:hypothetical protein
MSKLAHSINRSVIVAVPTFFGDDSPRRCKLVDIEPSGLWLGGEEVSERLAKFEGRGPSDSALAAVFFPFAQIGYLLDPAQVGTPPGGPVVKAGEAKAGTGGGEARKTNRKERSHPRRSEHKGSKPAR